MKEFLPAIYSKPGLKAFFLQKTAIIFWTSTPRSSGSKRWPFEALLAEESPESHSHETFLSKIHLSVGEMVASLNALEAVGLVATYYQKGEKFNNFVYCLYAPKDPERVFR
jgi:hypothetical protein